MLILPDRNIPRTKLLLPMADRHWRSPSQAQRKNIFGHENRTRFRIRARLHDGHVAWVGWFDDRADFDAFLNAICLGTLHTDRFVQRLPTPWWNPDLQEYPGIFYEFVTVSFITSGTTFVVPADCIGVSGQSGEFIDTIAGGGGGGEHNSSGMANGGSGAAWSRNTGGTTAVPLTPGSSVTIQVGAGGAALSSGSSSVNSAGNPGTRTWFNGATFAAASVGSEPGLGGAIANQFSSTAATAGGLASGRPNSGNTSGNNGGNSGACTGAFQSLKAAGAGGAAGLNGAGVNGTNSTASSTATAGGAGDNGSGGAGSAGSNSASSNGSDGTEYDATHGSGGGAGGVAFTGGAGSALAGNGGNYGAGGGGTAVNAGVPVSNTTGAGGPGLIVLSYAPFVPPAGLLPESPYTQRYYYNVVTYGPIPGY